MRLLAISGSLRAQSTNTNLLRALLLIAPAGIEIVLYEGLGEIPPFNPDLEFTHEFDPVTRLRNTIKESNAVLFSTPEYAHGVPGVLKNALDWIVGSGELSGKLVAVVNASSRGIYAQTSLKEVLTTMDAKLLHQAEVSIDLPSRTMSPSEISAEPRISSALNKSLQAVVHGVRGEN